MKPVKRPRCEKGGKLPTHLLLREKRMVRLIEKRKGVRHVKRTKKSTKKEERKSFLIEEEKGSLDLLKRQPRVPSFF